MWCNELYGDFFEDLYNLFNEKYGDVIFNSGYVDFLMMTVEKFEVGPYFYLISYGLH